MCHERWPVLGQKKMDIHIMKKARSLMLALGGFRREVLTVMQELYFLADGLALPEESTQMKHVEAVRSAFARKQRDMMATLNSGECTELAISGASELLKLSHARAVAFSETLKEWAKAANNRVAEGQIASARCRLSALDTAIGMSVKILPTKKDVAQRTDRETSGRPTTVRFTLFRQQRRGLGE
jgi:hypothetical protein